MSHYKILSNYRYLKIVSSVLQACLFPKKIILGENRYSHIYSFIYSHLYWLDILFLQKKTELKLLKESVQGITTILPKENFWTFGPYQWYTLISAEGQRMTDATNAKMGTARVAPAMINRLTMSRSAAMAHLWKTQEEMNTPASYEPRVCITTYRGDLKPLSYMHEKTSFLPSF